MILADLWEENSDLKGDAMFLDSLVTLLSAVQTSNNLLPFLNTFKRNTFLIRSGATSTRKKEKQFRR